MNDDDARKYAQILDDLRHGKPVQMACPADVLGASTQSVLVRKSASRKPTGAQSTPAKKAPSPRTP